jgi:hypothetical protein
MAIPIYRAGQLYNKPPRRGEPAQRGVFNCGKTLFYEEIEPDLEKVNLGRRAKGYTGRSVERKIEESIAKED